MSIYKIEYEIDGVVKVENVKAYNPGHAFAKYLKQNPGVKLLRSTISNRVAGHEFWIEYKAPKVQRAPEPTHQRGKELTEQFAFMESVAVREK